MAIYVTNTKEKRILDKINEINNMCLFDKDLAFSKKWVSFVFLTIILTYLHLKKSAIKNKNQDPDEFISEMTKSGRIINETVTELFNSIENEIEEIGNLLIVPPKEMPNSRKKKKPNLKELIQLEPRLDLLKDFYSEKLYNAINLSVLNSLKYLAEGCGYLLDYEESLDYIDGSNEASNDTLKYLRVKSTEDLTRPKNTDRPLSVSSVLLKTSWKNEKELEEASSLRF